jgi:hypothetical protein
LSTDSGVLKQVRLDAVIESAVPAEHREIFGECFSDFIASQSAEDAKLKYRLASIYTLLRMNGVGNWGRDDLRTFFSKKKFVLDTNVLFELLGAGSQQFDALFEHLSTLDAEFVVGVESLKELETALRTKADQAAKLISKGLNLLELTKHSVFRAPWLSALLDDAEPLTAKSLNSRIERLLDFVERFIAGAGIGRVHLEREGDSAARSEKIAELQRLAFESRGWDKSELVVKHDALLWEAVEDDSPLADYVMTLDSSLPRVLLPNGKRLGVMFDEVVAAVLIGEDKEDRMAQLFSFSLSQNMLPDSGFLSMADLIAVADMEVKLLSGPPKALRTAAAKLAQLRRSRAATGVPIPPDEVGRLILSAVSSYEDDKQTIAALSEEKARLQQKVVALEPRIAEGRSLQEQNVALQARVDELASDLTRRAVDAETAK